MSLASKFESIDPAAARSDMLVVLLEGIHPSAVEALRHDGYTRIVTHAKSLAGIELRTALAEASFLGWATATSARSSACSRNSSA